jgi:heterodisulfide reductase subunit C
MGHESTSRVQSYIGDPVSDAPAVDRDMLEEVFQDIQADIRYDHELNGCLNCGICTATCPAAHYYDFSPREIVQLLWTENLEGIYDAMQEKIWACAQCYTCAARCPFGNSPGGLIMLMREAAIKHGMQSAKDVLRPFSRVMLNIEDRRAAEAVAQGGPGADHAYHGNGVAGQFEDFRRALHDLGNDRGARPA